MSFGEAIASVFSNYANFDGRARRSEYWYFYLLNTIITFPLNILSRVDGIGFVAAIIYLVYAIAIFVPSLAVAVRRLHDTGRSGFWYFIILVPCIGSILLIIWLATDGDYGTNAYGPNPKINHYTDNNYSNDTNSSNSSNSSNGSYSGDDYLNRF